MMVRMLSRAKKVVQRIKRHTGSYAIPRANVEQRKRRANNIRKHRNQNKGL